MSIEMTRRILRTLKLISDMPSGAGWATPVEIIKWSGVKHATAYRYLPKLEGLGYLHVEEYKCRKITCKRYRITKTGESWFDDLNMMF